MSATSPEPILPPATEVGDAEIRSTETGRPFVRTPVGTRFRPSEDLARRIADSMGTR